ncbi:hypothetical protein [Richelia sinica]|uniref:hypothetical protein n=1 Tax=Richelia sinica TaxID=1357545 RepID=UPI0016855969|nr:hypothetical protein [Richelia sinica]MBD2667387.1 hypothetical protein [Richelia sinica FACHB-800]
MVQVRWHKVLLLICVGILVVMVGTAVYTWWRQKDGWCIKFNSDGSEKVLYGAECQR